jgi:phosphatidylglycerol:prolipoprotein diacylglycerol transferase
LLSFGPVAVRWYGVLALVGLGLAIWLSSRALQRNAGGRRLALDGLAWALPIGLVGARLANVLGYWDYYLTQPAELWQISLDGLSLWGGLAAGGLIFAARVGRGGASQRRQILDAVAPYVLLGIAIGRFGEFIDGQGQGAVSGLPWATQYASHLASSPDFGVARHPAQLYDGLLALALFGVLLWLVPAKLPAGSRVAIALVAYAVGRLALGTVRLDPTFAFGLQIEQLLAIGGIVIGSVFGLRPLLRRRAPRSARSQESADAQRLGRSKKSAHKAESAPSAQAAEAVPAGELPQPAESPQSAHSTESAETTRAVQSKDSTHSPDSAPTTQSVRSRTSARSAKSRKSAPSAESAEPTQPLQYTSSARSGESTQSGRLKTSPRPLESTDTTKAVPSTKPADSGESTQSVQLKTSAESARSAHSTQSAESAETMQSASSRNSTHSAESAEPSRPVQSSKSTAPPVSRDPDHPTPEDSLAA